MKFRTQSLRITTVIKFEAFANCITLNMKATSKGETMKWSQKFLYLHCYVNAFLSFCDVVSSSYEWEMNRFTAAYFYYLDLLYAMP